MINLTFQNNNKTFSVEIPLLIAANKFITTLLIQECYGLAQQNSQEYKYNFSENDLIILGKLTSENFEKTMADRFYAIPYNFKVKTNNKIYKGIIDLTIKFIEQDTLNESYLIINVLHSKETDFFVGNNYSKDVQDKIFKEILTKMTGQIFKSITKNRITKFKQEDCTLIYSTEIDLESIKENSIGQYIDESIVDCFHILNNFYLKNNTPFSITTEDILKERGLKETPNINGNRCGFKKRQKEKIKNCLNRLDTLGIISLIELSENNFLVDIKNQGIIYEIPKKILTYNNKTQIAEKRLGEYISFLMYFSKTKKLKVKVAELIKIIEDRIKTAKPSEIRDKLEKTLDNLMEAKIFKEWHYKKISEEELYTKNKLEKYKKLFIEIK